ncbi:MAG: glycine dehydrogenase, partial [Alphaproteobacteria bacterium]|nr:glycine dehydrogenase [Alphaproteobacteria bacterium]
IRREKATSNICTNSGLCALAFNAHMTLLGEKGLRELAAENHRLAILAADRLAKVPGVDVLNTAFFNEFTLMLGGRPARDVVRGLAERGVLGGVSLGRLYPGVEALDHALLVAVTEMTTEEDIETLASELETMVKETA